MSESNRPTGGDQPLARSVNDQDLARPVAAEPEETSQAEEDQQDARQPQGTREEAHQAEEERPQAGEAEEDQGDQSLVDKAIDKAQEKGLLDARTADEVRNKGLVDAIKDKLKGR